MKLASYKHGRDGKLMVVNADLTRCTPATDIAATMQQALDDWADSEPKLRALSKKLESGEVKGESFNPALCASPLPRAYQIADGSAYLNHVELVRKARGAEMPPEFRHDPLMYQAVSDTILGPLDPVPVASEEYGIDFEAEVAVITDDVPMGVTPEDAAKHIKLVMLMNDVTLRNLIPAELSKGFGFFNGKPPSAFTPVAVTPDALGAYWDGGKLHRPLLSTLNGARFGAPETGVEMQFDFPALLAHAAKTRPLGAGTIMGSGTISNSDENAGSSCLAEVRMIETIKSGKPQTAFMKYGDTIRIEALDDAGKSIFGAIEQKIVPYVYQSASGKKAANG
jgi:fumarylacetoacetate (FAA) hydrolase